MPEVEIVGLTPQVSGAILQWFNDVEQTAKAIIEAIPLMSDEELQQTHDRADELERVSWIVKAAARTEILTRAARLAGGRGNRDIDEKGRVALATKLAPVLKASPKVILEDASIYSNFFKTTLGAK